MVPLPALLYTTLAPLVNPCVGIVITPVVVSMVGTIRAGLLPGIVTLLVGVNATDSLACL